MLISQYRNEIIPTVYDPVLQFLSLVIVLTFMKSLFASNCTSHTVITDCILRHLFAELGPYAAKVLLLRNIIFIE